MVISPMQTQLLRVAPPLKIGFLFKKTHSQYFHKRLPQAIEIWNLNQSLFKSRVSHVQLFAAPWTAACQASLSFTKLMSIKLVMPSNHLFLCCPLLLLPSIFPSIRVFPNESALRIRWPKYWSFNFSTSTSNEYSELISFIVTTITFPQVPEVRMSESYEAVT